MVEHVPKDSRSDGSAMEAESHVKLSGVRACEIVQCQDSATMVRMHIELVRRH